MMKGKFYFGKPIKGHERLGPLDAGDDAVPYTGHCLISVADGTGARSGGPQLSINPQLLDADTSFYAATRGCLGKQPEQYRDQYMENFGFLFDVGQEYRAVHPRKSGYFGSRLASIIMRRRVEDKRFRNAEELSGFVHALHDASEEERAVLLKELEHELAEKLHKSLSQAASNCGMAWDYNNDNNLSLMGTTYSGVIFHEEEDCVHLVSIQAGDSLCIALTAEKDGNGQPMLAFRQLLPAQERESDGGLSNCIGTNHDFHFCCAYHCLPKPCMIMAASDGCFDAFPTMRWFEHFVVSHLANDENTVLEDAMQSMRAYFASGASMDDSSTMAVAAFGFEAYAQLRRMAANRRDDLDTRYGMRSGQAEAALTPDEEAQLEENRVQRQMEQNTLMRSRAEECWKGSAWLREKVLARLEEPAHKAKVEAQLQKESARSGEIHTECEAKKAELYQMIRKYWLTLRERTGGQKKTGIFGGRTADPCDELADKLTDRLHQREKIQREIGNLRAQAKACAEQLTESSMDYSLPEDASAQDMERCHRETMAQLERQMQQLRSAGDRLIGCRYEQARLKTDVDRMFPQLLREEAGAIDAVMSQMLEARKPQRFDDLEDDVQQQFIALLSRIEALEREAQALADEVFPRIREEYAYRLFIGRPVMLCLECINEHGDTLPAGLYAQLQAALQEIEERFPSATEKSRQARKADAEHEQELYKIMVQKV